MAEKDLEKGNLEGEAVQNEAFEEQNENVENQEAEKSAEETSDNCDDKVKKLEAELEEWKNSYTRKLAEFQNFTKRKENEVAEMRKYASEGIIVKLLDNIDNLERAVDASKESQNFDSLIEGVNMILNNLKNLLTEEGVEEIEAAGKEYDPYEHKAMITENKEEMDDNVVVQVFQKGYKMKKIILSLSMLLTSTFAVDCDNAFIKAVVSMIDEPAPTRVDENSVIMGATCENETLKTTFVINDSEDIKFSKFTKDQIEEFKKMQTEMLKEDFCSSKNPLIDKASWIYNYEDGKNFTVINLTKEDYK